ncbi:MAG: NADH-quinone oxidoreductase subunit L, partial [Desulfoprunum sp.]|nr:NADH-quinone oxidoreductase subunit L [Desulfoprunum sp.]
MKTALELIVLLPLLGATLNILLGRILPRRVVEGMACAVIWGSFVSALFAAGAYSGPAVVEIGAWLSAFDLRAPITFYLDPLSLALCLMITFVCGLIHLYSIGYMGDDDGYVRYFALLNLFVGAMLLLVLAENLPLLYLGWEGVGFCSYALIGFWYKEVENATAGRKAFIVTRIGDLGLGIAIVWMFKVFNTLSITQVNQTGHLASMEVITALGLLLLLGAMGKSAQAPLMVWLPDAMAGPTPVSAQIHAATMVTAGVYLLMRMFPLIGVSSVVVAAIAVTGAFTAFYGATCALVERDLKRILAFSTISQIGFMMLAVGCGAITAATFHLIVHAFFKALLFLGAGCIITAMHHEQDIFRMGGLRRTLPGVFWPFLAGALCLAGVPPTGGFFSKDGILAVVWAKGGMLYGALYGVAMLTVFLTAIYTFRMMFLVFGERLTASPPTHASPTPVKSLPRMMKIILIPLALLGLVGGIFNFPAYLGSGLLQSFLAPLKGNGEHLSQATELALQGAASVVALSGLGLAWWYFGRQRRQVRIARAEQPPSAVAAFLQAGWYVDSLYNLLFIRPYKQLSAILWERMDEGVIDDS